MRYLLLYKKIILFLFFIGLGVSFITCEKNAASPVQEDLPAIVSFRFNIQPMLTTYCAMGGCHSGSQPPARLDLSPPNAYSNLLAEDMIDTTTPASSRLYTCLSSPMPPWGELIKYDQDLILKWIQQGAKNN